MTTMTNREALTYAMEILATINESDIAPIAREKLGKMIESLDRRAETSASKRAEYSRRRTERKTAEYSEAFAQIVKAFDEVGEVITLTDLIRGNSDLHANMTTQKLVQIIKHGDGSIVKAKVKGKMLYGRRDWFPADAKIVEDAGEEE